MLGSRRNPALSIEELISRLEHIEESELRCDIRANVRAELKRMKRNISAILRFVSHANEAELAGNLELHQAVLEIRRECLMLNGTISRILVQQMLWLSPERWEESLSRAAAQYAEMAQWAHQMCQIKAPLRAQELMAAL